MISLDRRSIISAIGAVIMGAVAFAIVMVALWLMDEGDPQDALLATGTPVPDAEFYVVQSEQSQLLLTVDSQIGAIDGTFAIMPGAVELHDTGDGWRVIANLMFDARTLDLGNEQVNTVLRRALEVDTYPYGVFVAQSSALLPDLDSAQTVDLLGKLELHGAVNDYTIPATVTRNGDSVTLNAQVVINVGDFGVSIPSLIASEQLAADLLVVTQPGTPDDLAAMLAEVESEAAAE